MPELGLILVVDDDGNTRALLQRILRSMGLGVVQAADNETGLQQVAKRSFSLITTDLNRPGGSGIDFVRQVRSMPNGRQVPILMISGNATHEAELDAWRAGVSGFMRKPFGIEELSIEVEKMTVKITEIDRMLLNVAVEGRDLDYKERIDLDSNTSKAELARDIIAMANSGGGRLVVGVAERDDSFERIGVPAAELLRYETTKINDAVKKYVTATAYVSSRVVEYQGNRFIFIEIYPSEDTIALAAIPNEKAGLYPGRIYIRTQDGRTTELTDPLDLRRLIDRLVENKLKRLTGHGDN